MKKSLLKLASAILSAGLLISLIPGAAVFADDTITVDGQDFVLQSDGLYKCSLTMYEYWHGSAHPYTYKYCLLTQNIIDTKFDGGLPVVVNPTQENCYYYLGEDVTIKKSTQVLEHSGCTIELRGRTITYMPEDNSAYMWNADGVSHCSIKFQGSFFPNVNSTTGGKISSPNGAPIARLGGDSTENATMLTSDIKITGGYDINYYDKRNSAIFVGSNAELNIYYGTEITFFSAEQGGAICGAENSDITFLGEIRRCYASEGGGIYCAGELTMGGKVTSNTAEVRGGGICIKGSNASIISYNPGGDYPAPSITYNTCNRFENDDQGGGGLYVDSDHSTPIGLGDMITINNNSNGTGYKKNLYFICNDNNTDFISYSRIDQDSARIGISASGLKTGDTLIRISGYSNYYSENISKIFFCDQPNTKFQSPKTFKNEYGSTMADLLYVEDTTAVMDMKGYSLITDGSKIGIRFYISIPQSYANNSYRLEADVMTDDGSECYVLGKNEQQLTTSYGSEYVMFTYYVDSTDMTVPLTINVHWKDNTKILFSKSGIKVSDYIEALVNDPARYGDASIIAARMALYGAAAQKYFNFRTDDLADKNITDDMRSKASLSQTWESRISGEYYDPQVDSYNMALPVPAGENVSFYAWTMSFKGTPSLKLYFKPENGADIDKIHLSCSGYFTTSVKKVSGGKYLCLTLDNVSMTQMMNSIQVYAWYDENETNDIDMYLRPINYATRIINESSNYSPEAVALCRAFYTLVTSFSSEY